MVFKQGRYGQFLACSGYPECKNTRDLQSKGSTDLEPEPTDLECKVCGARMVVKRSRAGQRFLACEKYPECTHTESISTNIPCPNDGCEGMVVEKASKKGRKFYACNQYPECRFAMWDEPFDDVCPECGSHVLGVKRPKGEAPVLSCREKGCGFKKPMPSS